MLDMMLFLRFLVEFSKKKILIHPNLVDDIPFKGVALSHRKILDFGMWLKLTKFKNFFSIS
jgi:hypothetical protein